MQAYKCKKIIFSRPWGVRVPEGDNGQQHISHHLCEPWGVEPWIIANYITMRMEPYRWISSHLWAVRCPVPGINGQQLISHRLWGDYQQPSVSFPHGEPSVRCPVPVAGGGDASVSMEPEGVTISSRPWAVRCPCFWCLCLHF